MHTAETFFLLYRHTEQETLTVQKGRIWPYIPSYKKRTRHVDVRHSINSIICVKVKLLYLNKHNAMSEGVATGIRIAGTKWRRVTTLRVGRFTSRKQLSEPIR
jgi:hypothetical protein